MTREGIRTKARLYVAALLGVPASKVTDDTVVGRTIIQGIHENETLTLQAMGGMGITINSPSETFEQFVHFMECAYDHLPEGERKALAKAH